MISNYISAIWEGGAPAMGNHLWQSTLCVVIAGLLALALRKNSARARYAIWLAASLKFLLPFSLLVALGGQFAKPRVVTEIQKQVYVIVRHGGEPLSAAVAISPAVHPAAPSGLVPMLPAMLAAIWSIGFVVVVLVWCARWRRISKSVKKAVRLQTGREVNALRRLERLGGIRKQINLILSPDSLEPGIFGILRPVLVWPQGISEHLQDAHLDAIISHEVLHVRRRDNLAAALHMAVEAIFWFHPLVWWLGSQLLEERERACDEEVLQLGNEPKVYAESILKACEFCVESPLACVAGVTGADLKQRIVRIMTKPLSNKLNLGKKLLVYAIGIAAVAGPVVYGLVHPRQIRAMWLQTTIDSRPSFEVASIKPNRSGDMRFFISMAPGRFTATGATAKFLISFAYDVKDFQISGGPRWIGSDKFNVDAKEDDSLVQELKKLPDEKRGVQIRLRIQSLLADRFKLSLSHTTKDLPVYALVVAKNGPKLQESKPDDTYPNAVKGIDGHSHAGMMRFGGGQLTGQVMPMSSLAEMLSHQLGRNVIDKTGLTGKYDFTLKWTPDQNEGAMFKGPEPGSPGADNAPPSDSSGPSIFTAIQEQLGLKLESQKGPVDILVIDHIEKPSED